MTDAFLEERRLRQLMKRPDDFMTDRNKGWFLPIIDDNGEDTFLGPDPSVQLLRITEARQRQRQVELAEERRQQTAAAEQYQKVMFANVYAAAWFQSTYYRNQMINKQEFARQLEIVRIKSFLAKETKQVMDLYYKNQQFWQKLKGSTMNDEAFHIYNSMVDTLNARSAITVQPLLIYL
jgi:hypothetical protein